MWGLPLAGTAGSNPAWKWMSLSLALVVLLGRSLIRANHSSKGIYLSVGCLSVIAKPLNTEAPDPVVCCGAMTLLCEYRFIKHFLRNFLYPGISPTSYFWFFSYVLYL